MNIYVLIGSLIAFLILAAFVLFAWNESKLRDGKYTEYEE